MSRLSLILLIITVVYSYLSFRVSMGLPHEFQIMTWITMALLIGLIFLYPLTWKRRQAAMESPNNNNDTVESTLRWLIYLDMGFLSFFGSLVVLRDLVFVPVAWLRPEWNSILFGPMSASLTIAIALFALSAGVYWARSGPRIREVRIPIENLPVEFEDFRIAQISDLHIGPTIRRDYVERVVNLVNGLNPDMTVLTGDIGDGSTSDFSDDAKPLERLLPRDQSYYVTGNHEYYWNGPQWLRQFSDLGLKLLLNSHQLINRGTHTLMVAGVLDPAARLSTPLAKPDLQATLAGAPRSSIKILLSHHPGIADEAAQAGFDLQLSGHTHAGQFFPWTLVVRRVHQFHRGLDSIGKMWIYVNPGTGTWGPPIRLGTTPEITLLRLIRK